MVTALVQHDFLALTVGQDVDTGIAGDAVVAVGLAVNAAHRIVLHCALGGAARLWRGFTIALGVGRKRR
ncbi:MAG: hypothetical protein U5K38_11265 [Woeseiaceae bacterium]|nr:hypothetical protein [Woeseiaceae bacterium]